jgi:hypothetical protein
MTRREASMIVSLLLAVGLAVGAWTWTYAQEAQKDDIIRVVLILGSKADTNAMGQWTVPHAPQFLLCTEAIPPDATAFEVVCWEALFDGYMVDREPSNDVLHKVTP